MKKVIIYTDGASRGNPGMGSIGVVFCNEKEEIIKRYSEYLGDKVTNNEAEYSAVVFAFKKFSSVFGKKLAASTEIELRSDSELLVKQMKGEYKITNPRMQDLFMQVWNLKIDFAKVTFRAIPREKNKEADRLANEALDALNKKSLF
ncbi:MAG: ribonuclease HI family protein [Candidatus Pacebacteria bacterium]|nr:ribonuclease HI family protein [Candidatus Paceibacterota bacterium]